MKPIAGIDTETGGFEASTDALCSIGLAVIDLEAPKVECLLYSCHWPIHVPMDSPLRVTEEALSVQGLSRRDLAEGGRYEETMALRDLQVVLEYLSRTYPGIRAYSWNSAFDYGFVMKARERRSLGKIRRDPYLCAQQFCWVAQDLGLVDGPKEEGLTKLAHWAKRYGLEQPEPHAADIDAAIAGQVLWNVYKEMRGR